MQKIFCSLFVFLACSTFPLPAFAQNTSHVPHSTTQRIIHQKKAEAAAFLKNEQYNEAFEVYSYLLREDPTDDIINLGYARAAVRSQRFGHAVMAYERLLANHPDEPLLLKELAYALHIQNDTQRSAMELQKNTAKTPQQNTALLNKWEKQNQRTNISGRLRGGLLYDSNVNGGPASNTVSLGDWKNLSLIDGKAEESMAAYMGGHVNMSHRLGLVSPWHLVGNFDFFARYNMNEQLDKVGLSSSEWGALAMGVRHLGTHNLFELKARAQLFDYAFEQQAFSVGPQVNIIYVITPTIQTITKADIGHRSYSENQGYDGWYTSAGQYMRFFVGSDKHHFTIGGRYIGSGTKEHRYAYDGFETSLTFTFNMPYNNISMSPSIYYSGKYYHGTATTLETEHRRDHRLTLGLALTIPIREYWQMNLGYQYARNFSNSELYDYDRHLTTMGISWLF